MARISGVDLPREKRVEVGLTYVFGIGLPSSKKILAEAGINPDTRVKDLTEDEVSKLREIIDRDYVVEGDLRRNVALDIKRLMEIGCYRGVRHRKGLPVTLSTVWRNSFILFLLFFVYQHIYRGCCWHCSWIRFKYLERLIYSCN